MGRRQFISLAIALKIVKPNQAQREFVRLWTRDARRVFGFVLTILPHREDAEEVLQETGITAWEKFDEYELGTNFRAWASRIAYFKVLEHRRSAGADRIVFSLALVDAIDATFEEESPLLELRREALHGCVEKLSPQDRQLIQLRYEPEATITQVATTVGRSNDAIYKAIRRIHASLFDCIERVLRQQGHR